MSASTTRPVYHVRHDLQPKLTEELLLLLHDKCPCRASALQQAATERGYQIALRSPDQLIASLGSLRIVTRSDAGDLQLSPSGRLIAESAKSAPHLIPELIHFTYYTLYDVRKRMPRFSWAYRLVCEHLWGQRTRVIDGHRLIALVEEQAQETFDDCDQYGVSFSLNSVAGIVNWLEALDPSCITRTTEGKLFSRRSDAPVEAMLLAAEYARYRTGGIASSQLHVTAEVRRMIAHLCMLEEDAISPLLEATAAAFGLAYRQTERGEWISLLGRRSPLPITAWFPTSDDC